MENFLSQGRKSFCSNNAKAKQDKEREMRCSFVDALSDIIVIISKEMTGHHDNITIMLQVNLLPRTLLRRIWWISSTLELAAVV